MRKGIELPLNTMVVLAAAMIVLIVLVVLFMLVFPAPFGPFAMESAKNQACLQVTSDCANANPSGISVSFDVKNKDGTDLDDNLQSMCERYYGCGDKTTDNEKKDCCKKVCGCAVTSPTTGSVRTTEGGATGGETTTGETTKEEPMKIPGISGVK